MATISKLSVALVANTAPFSKGLATASKKLSAFGSKVKSLGGAGLAAAGKAFKFAGAAALAAGAAIAFFVKKELGAIDETAKLSQRIGISTESLTAYGLAAEKSGVSQDQFSDTMKDFNKNLGKLKLGDSVSAFDKLGLSQKRLSGLNTDKALSLVADELAKVEDISKRASLAQDLFGESGFKLLPLLSQGSAGLKQFREEADMLGITFNAIDAKKVENANDALLVMGKSFTGVFRNIATQVAPVVERFAQIITDAVVNFRKNTLPVIFDFVNQSVNAFREFLVTALPTFINFGRGVLDMINFVIDGFVDFGNFIVNVFGSVNDEADGSTNHFENFFNAIGDGVTFARTAFENMGTTVDIIMFNIINSVAKMVKSFISIIKKIPGIKFTPAGVLLSLGAESFVDDIIKGSRALKDEAEDELVDKFVANKTKFDKENEDSANKFLNIFDRLAGLGDFKFKIPDLLKASGIGGDLAKTATSKKPQELRALEKGSAEAFKAINKGQADPLNVAKQGVKEQKMTNKILKRLSDNLNQAPTLTVLPV